MRGLPDLVRATPLDDGHAPGRRTAQVAPVEPVAQQRQGLLSPPQRSPRPWLAIVGGITALVALPVVLVGCALPFINWSDTSNGSSSSIFGPGFAAGYWFAAEPVAVVLGAVPAAIVLIVVKHLTARAVAAGLLMAFGAQTVAMFLGYTFGDLGFGRIGPGGPVGLVGGAILFAGGAFGLGSLFMRD